MVVGCRIHEGRENSDVRVLRNRCCTEASSGGRIDLEDSVARLAQGTRNVRRWGVRNLWRSLAESFPCMF